MPEQDATIHLTLSRGLWEPSDQAFITDALDQHDLVLGRLLREETARALTRLERRTGRANRGRVKHIEITLTDGAVATLDDDPDAHIP